MLTSFRLFLVRLLTPAPTAATKDVLARIQTILGNNSSGKPDACSMRRRQLADLILPDIMSVAGDGKTSVTLDGRQLEIDTQNAKLWAQACSQIVGLLAGIAVKPGHTTRALDEVFSTAKKIAGSMSNSQAARRTELTMPGLGTTETTSASGSTGASPATAPSVNKSAALQAREQMIADLETQAELELNPEAKVALKNLADNMRKELELDKVA